MGTRDLARQRLVEVAPVLKAGKRVEIGELASPSSSRTSSSVQVWARERE
jgi:hypothetical protein